MRSIAKMASRISSVSKEEKEVKVLIDSLKNVLTDVPYDFVYENSEDDEDNEVDNDEYYD